MIDYNLENLGPNLKTLREKTGKSQRIVCAEMEIDFANYQLIESGKSTNIKLNTLLKILKYYDVTLEKLLA